MKWISHFLFGFLILLCSKQIIITVRAIPA